MKYFVYASCREENRPFFEELKNRSGDCWIWVGDETSLVEVVSSVQVEIIFFVHWRKLVSKQVLERCSCICLHMTKLPFGRGGSPLQNLILRGFSETELTAFLMDENLDTGPILAASPMSLEGAAWQILDRAGALGIHLIETILSGNCCPFDQRGEETVFVRRTPADSRIPSDIGGSKLYDFIRMLDAEDYPKAFFNYGGNRYEFSAVENHGDSLVAKVKIVSIDR